MICWMIINNRDIMSKKDKTLKDILDLILYENLSTQDEIAEKLGITRRYVTQLLQPLVKDGTVKATINPKITIIPKSSIKVNPFFIVPSHLYPHKYHIKTLQLQFILI